VPTLEQWKTTQGKTLAIFSSGSVAAQLKFFSYVRDGPNETRDIKPLFSAHYDTVNAGPKLEKESYEKICSELAKDVSKVTFLTDNVKGTFGGGFFVTPYFEFVKQHTTCSHRPRPHPTSCLALTSVYLPTHTTIV
jgi:hypothetical protein